MRLLIVGGLQGQIGLATKIAMDKGATVTHAADIALIDFNMHGKDGLELASELRVTWPHMPIAILTANIQDEIIFRARQIGAAFVPKPITVDGLEGFIAGAALRLRANRT